MYDIIFVSSNKTHPEYLKIKQRFPLAKITNDFRKAKRIALTDFYWIVWDDLIVNFDFDYTPDEWSKNYVHVFKNNNFYDGIVLIPKHINVTDNEIKHRFFVNCKEVNIVASVPKPYDLFFIDSYNNYKEAFSNSTTEMFWMSSNMISHDIDLVNNFYISHHDIQLRNQTHAFIHNVDDQRLYNGLFLCSKRRELAEREIEYRFPVNRIEHNVVGSTKKNYSVVACDTYDEYLSHLENPIITELFWMIPSYVNPSTRFKFDTYFTHNDSFNRTINHVYLNGKYHDGIVLCSKHAKFSQREFDYKFIANKKEVNVVISTPKPYDIVFISYQEPNADENYACILERFPKCKRIHGVKGIHQAHIEGAKLCSTDLFWIIDGDAIITDNFNFDYQVARWDKETVHVWRSQNPINDMVYGYGGVKLFPTQLTIDMDTSKTDMTTSISTKFKAVHNISNITAFNTDPFNTWKSAFRECTKLASKIIDRQKNNETDERLHTWCTVGTNRPFGEYAISGAKAGAVYGARNQDNIDALKKINDFDWLMEQFNANV
tara:strand:- start:1439 stop:3076 length:1638 start_codon:yes stop_codon:yes gene_type:complete